MFTIQTPQYTHYTHKPYGIELQIIGDTQPVKKKVYSDCYECTHVLCFVMKLKDQQ